MLCDGVFSVLLERKTPHGNPLLDSYHTNSIRFFDGLPKIIHSSRGFPLLCDGEYSVLLDKTLHGKPLLETYHTNSIRCFDGLTKI